ncbi:MAG: hypothetical protein V1793_14895 [Pseudomonadota bacterium]
MKDYLEQDEASCSSQCHSDFLDCMDSNEDESVCIMKRVPCLCACDRVQN